MEDDDDDDDDDDEGLPNELFVYASVTREEGIRSLEHSGIDVEMGLT